VFVPGDPTSILFVPTLVYLIKNSSVHMYPDTSGMVHRHYTLCGGCFYLSSFNSVRPNVMGPTPSHVFTTSLSSVYLGTTSFKVCYTGSHYIVRVRIGRSLINIPPHRSDVTRIPLKCVRSMLVVKHLWLPTNPHLLGFSGRSQPTF